MLFEYIINNYDKDEPIFISELPGKSKNSICQELKKLVDEGKLERLYNGVYYLSYTTILGTKGRISVDKFVNKKYMVHEGITIGYITGMQLANMYGFTSQNPSCIEVCSNEATTTQRKLNIAGRTVIVYKPLAKVTEKNKTALQFLDFMTVIDIYSEISGDALQYKLKEYVKEINIDFKIVREYIALYPDKVYRNIYQGGLMHELV